MHDIVNNSVLSANYYMKKLINHYLRMRKEIQAIMHSETFLVRIESKENN